MSELNLPSVRRRYYPVKTKLSAVRDRVINEMGYAEVLSKYEVKPSTFHVWLHKYKSRVLSEEQHKRLSSRNYKMLYPMTDQERAELETLRQEVEKQKILVEAHELMLELARERLHVDVKKKLRGDAISGIVERQKERGGKAVTEHLCNSLGYSKQAYYKSLRADRGGEERERYVLSIVQDIRRDMPNLGVNKLWNMLGSNGLPVGRDWLYRLLHLHDLMIKQKKYRVITTDSRAWHRQFPNLVKGFRVTRPNQVWVSDITYLSTSAGFVYLSLVTDAYSRRITGWEVHPTLDSSGPVKALCRALATLPPNFSDKLVHHSDRGGQYCSSLYTGILKEHGIQVSVTQDGSPYDNGIAERVNGILKREWLNDMVLRDIDQARMQVERIIGIYNTRRPHMAIGLKVPDQAHRDKKELFARVMY